MKPALAIVIIGLTLAAQPAPALPMMGGYKLIDTKADMAIKAKDALRTYLGQKFQVMHIVKAEKQVVNGTNVRLTCKVLDRNTNQQTPRTFVVHFPLPSPDQNPHAPSVTPGAMPEASNN